MSRLRQAPLAAVVLALSGLPSIAWACPVCMAARDEAERLALIGTTVFLTALPVIMIGGVIIWLVRRTRDLEHDPFELPAPEFDAEARPAVSADVIPLLAQQSDIDA